MDEKQDESYHEQDVPALRAAEDGHANLGNYMIEQKLTVTQVTELLINLTSITHKFLVKKYTQNLCHSVHSVIERNIKRILRSGPMYTTDSFVTASHQGSQKDRKTVEMDFANSRSFGA